MKLRCSGARRAIVRGPLARAIALCVLCAIVAAAQQIDTNATLRHLDGVITWYRTATGKVQEAGQPSDAIYQENARTLAAQTVRFAFQAASAEADLVAARQKANSKTGAAAPGANSQQQGIAQTLDKVNGQIDQLQSEIAALNRQIPAARASRRKAMVSQRDNLQGELDLNNAMRDAIQKMSSFLQTSSENTNEGLQGSINQLKRSLPEIFGASGSKPAQNSPSPSQTPAIARTGGLIGQAFTLFRQMRDVHALDHLGEETDALKNSAMDLRKPLRDALVATIQQGRALAGQPPATEAGQIQANEKSFQDLTAQFKQLSPVVVPLSQEIVTLQESQSNFAEWRKAIIGESETVLAALLLRVIGILVALAIVLILSEVWRRFTFRYVHDARRRRQFLLLRRFVAGFAVAIVIILGFVSEFSSLATFAGFITAGVAVSLQAVLLSVAAYFFLIGRYGIRVGDRITISGVTGDVVDIGLVRLYVMELAGTGVDLYHTGRIVVFSNSVLFQATTPLYKQIPGTGYTWHEVAVSLAPAGNYRAAQEKLTRAVNSVFETYRPEIDAQHQQIPRHVDVEIAPPAPDGKLQFGDSGLEFVARYPAVIRKAAETDDQITRAIVDVMENDQEVKAAVSGSPKIRAAVKG